jgi:crotonobetainyl-CoA:carnitine CoA-transferase CaiB-like acyl-CoA transferase
MAGPLTGIRVLEFTQVIAGPFGCMLLADMGAEVIKVEPPGGETWRLFSQFMPGESKTFQELNRGKRSLVLNLADPRAQDVIHRLIPSVDVVVINYRPDVPANLHIDYETLSAIRPDLIYVDSTAFGRKGPMALRPGYDIVVQAVTGLMAGEGKVREDGAPEQIRSTAIADYGTGIAIAWAVSAALFHRQRTGEGQLVESSLLATALAFQSGAVMEHPIADAAFRAPARARRHELAAQGAEYGDLLAVRNPMAAFAGNFYYRPFRTSDGAIAIGALSPSLWAKVRAAIGTDFLGMADPERDPNNPEWIAKAEVKVAEIEGQVASKTTAEWLEAFERAGVPAGPVNFPEDMSTHPQVLANDYVIELQHELSGPQTQVAPMLKFARTPMTPEQASPPLGRDTDAYLREAGFDDREIARLRAEGVAE